MLILLFLTLRETCAMDAEMRERTLDMSRRVIGLQKPKLTFLL